MSSIRLRYIGERSDPFMLVTGKVYEAIGMNETCFAVIDETGEDYLYGTEYFEPADVESAEALERNISARNQTAR